MVKAKLFSYAHSGIYYKKYGISPDLHFDKLREKYGSKVAVEIVDRNMEKALRQDAENRRCISDRYEFMPVPEKECPF